eukprot:3240039-Pleurochrysis_carterae.AAC.1
MRRRGAAVPGGMDEENEMEYIVHTLLKVEKGRGAQCGKTKLHNNNAGGGVESEESSGDEM